MKLSHFLLGTLSSAMALQTHALPRTVSVHLFEWQWNSIAEECENVLGPKGFAAVQVSPPQKSINGSQWWTRYQPVSYAIEGRSGSRQEFASMVQRCNKVGVDIYVDAVINHMAAWDRNFPEVPYSRKDFNNCTQGIDYQDAWSIQNCDLVGLNDLKTSSNYVQGKIADYINDLISLGVKGFRIDAAKHMPNVDINNIVNRINGNPYIYLEVIGAGGEPIQPSDYTYLGDITEFNFSNTLGHLFKGRGPLKDISNIGQWDGWLTSDKAVVFVANHDNQRQNTNNVITHKDGNSINDLAHIFMMAWPYGYPRVMSSYDWDDHDQGPPESPAINCNNGWLCEHRRPAIANMVAFRNVTQDAFYVSNYWDNGQHQMAWGRGGLGFVAINRQDGQYLSQSLSTGMPEGTYCNVVKADFSPQRGTCDGETIQVDSNGQAQFNVSPLSAVAIHIDARIGNTSPTPTPDENTTVSFTCQNGDTYWGQSVYVVGNHPLLGDWNPANAVKLNPTHYPTWDGSVSLPSGQNIEWKCIKREDSNPSIGIEWQGGNNNTLKTGNHASGSASF